MSRSGGREPERTRNSGAAGSLRSLFRGVGLGPEPLRRQVVTHLLHASSEALVAVSLAGSLFFSVSLDAARPQVILYLLVTMAPFAVVTPLIGPLVGRLRGGARGVVVATCLGRAVVCWLMASDLRTLLFYPEAFAVLVLGKTYSVAKSALVPSLVPGDEGLVAANSRLSLAAVAGSGVTGAIGAGIIVSAGAPWVLRLAALTFSLATIAGFRIPRTRVRARARVGHSDVIEDAELHSPVVRAGGRAMGVLRAAVGFLMFLLAFALRRAGEPTWFYGLVFVASGAGSVVGSVTAPRLRRRLGEEWILGAALGTPALFALGGATRFTRVSILLAVLALGASASAARHAFDSAIQRRAPDVDRGRAFARFEAIFQMAWIGGAIAPVATGMGPRLGLGLLSAALAGTAIWYAVDVRAALRLDEEARSLRNRLLEADGEGRSLELSVRLVDSARTSCANGRYERAVQQAVTALDLALDAVLGSQGLSAVRDRLDALAAHASRSPLGDAGTRQSLDRALELHRQAVADGRAVTASGAREAVDAVWTVVTRLSEPGGPEPS